MIWIDLDVRTHHFREPPKIKWKTDIIHNPRQNMGIKCIQGYSEPRRGEPAGGKASKMGSFSIPILLQRLPFEKVKRYLNCQDKWDADDECEKLPNSHLRMLILNDATCSKPGICHFIPSTRGFVHPNPSCASLSSAFVIY